MTSRRRMYSPSGSMLLPDPPISKVSVGNLDISSRKREERVLFKQEIQIQREDQLVDTYGVVEISQY